MHLRLGCTNQFSLILRPIVVLDWVGLGPNFSTVLVVSGWVSRLMGWVGSGHSSARMVGYLLVPGTGG